MIGEQQAIDRIEDFLATEGITGVALTVRIFPGELFVIAKAPRARMSGLRSRVESIEDLLADTGMSVYVTLKEEDDEASKKVEGAIKGVHDPRAVALVELLVSRSRTSEIQPSLSYVRDVDANLRAAVAPRNHFIFGRRGAGKTALLVEARRVAESRGDRAIWFNFQTYRHESTERIMLFVIGDICEAVGLDVSQASGPETIQSLASGLTARCQALLATSEIHRSEVDRLVPEVNRMLKRYHAYSARELFVFLDDFYYVQRVRQPLILDRLHGLGRDSGVWFKIASIRHLTRWFQADPPEGLQPPHDVEFIQLDVTLQDPERASRFLRGILDTYGETAGIQRVTTVLSKRALDRLVLASGGVPRDYLTLAADAVRKAQKRPKARYAGVQDVNEAAGDAAQIKIQELETDTGSESGQAALAVEAFNRLRRFCLEETQYTYFRVGTREKEELGSEYDLLTLLADLRLVHLIDPSLSDAHKAGVRYEVYLLDLSQYSGSRLKQGIRVLDFSEGQLIARRTRSSEPARVGKRARELNTILRAAPVLDLGELSLQAEQLQIAIGG